MIIATNSKGKISELKAIFKTEEIKSLEDVNIKIEVEEDQDSFYGNALKKAKEIYEIAKEPTIADDSGLCIPIFDNWPGVLTHRFLGEQATPKERNQAILDRMKDLKGEDRKAKVVCNLVYYDGENILVGEGIIDGTIALNPRGENGFGFDEIFELPSGKTLGELSAEEKNQVSARAVAARDLNRKLINYNK